MATTNLYHVALNILHVRDKNQLRSQTTLFPGIFRVSGATGIQSTPRNGDLGRPEAKMSH